VADLDDGGKEARFSHDGRELVFRTHAAFYAAPLETVPEFKPGAPRGMFEAEGVSAYALASDGRLLWIRGERDRAATSLNLILDWAAELTRLTGDR
jgi:hypothetical protein